jgi:hypothetical protein
MTIDDSGKSRRGFKVWNSNPSALNIKLRAKEKPIKIEHGQDILLINCETSEILGKGTAGFFRSTLVDDEQFMKVYVGQLDAMFGLTKTGKHIFKIVWDQVQDHKDQDEVTLKPLMAKVQSLNISERVFQKGVRELLEKEFIYMGEVDGIYFINMGIFFNGNRIIAANEYIKRSSIHAIEQKGLK